MQIYKVLKYRRPSATVTCKQKISLILEEKKITPTALISSATQQTVQPTSPVSLEARANK